MKEKLQKVKIKFFIKSLVKSSFLKSEINSLLYSFLIISIACLQLLNKKK